MPGLSHLRSSPPTLLGWKPPEVLTALPQINWDDVTFWQNIYAEVQQHFGEAGRPDEVEWVPEPPVPEPPFQSWLGLRLPELPTAPPQLNDALNVTNQLIQIALNDFPPNTTLNVYDVAFSLGKLAAASDRVRIPVAPARKKRVPRSVLEEGVRIGSIAHEIYFKTGQQLARDLGMECLQYQATMRPFEPPYAVLRRGLEVIVVLKGSTGPDDSLTCLDALAIPFPPNATNPRNFAHAGFAQLANWMDNEVKDVLDEAAVSGMKRLTFTGHSLGGAVANLLAVQYEIRYPRVSVRSVGLAAPPCMSPNLARGANRICLNFVNGFDIVPRASVLAAKQVLRDVLDLRADESTSKTQSANGTQAARRRVRMMATAPAMLILFATRTRQCFRATQVQIMQQGAQTARYTVDLQPLDYYHIERGPNRSDRRAVVSKKPGSELERIDLTWHGLISDHIAGSYISELQAALGQQSLEDRENRIGAAFRRASFKRRG